MVVDPFAGSNITGEVAERLKRRWLAFELVEEYLEGSKFRFPGVSQQLPLFDKPTAVAQTPETHLARQDEALPEPAVRESKTKYRTKRKAKG
jgi:site-specific DNA-methyltransferase (cytosine-N4-specific)